MSLHSSVAWLAGVQRGETWPPGCEETKISPTERTLIEDVDGISLIHEELDQG